jgi:septal ring-binding cell division protein DamX
VATATPTPPPAPPPTAPPAPPPTAATGNALALFQQGAFDQSAQASASSLSASAQGRYSIQVLAACSPDTIRKAAQSVGGDEIFILPVTLNGRACFRVCWGVYDSREAAQAGVGTLPDYFRQSGISPRISPLVELLP